MIQRRDSIGFIELLRAKYKLTDLDYIQQQLEGTTAEERNKLKTQSFHDLWVGLWGSSPKENKQYKQEFDQASYKFNQLTSGYTHEGETISLNTLLEKTPVQWTTPEWGFPKGRRNQFESDKACACREFQEETGLGEESFTILDAINPIRETFYGNNGIHYCHVYFIALVHADTEVVYDSANEHMKQEIGGLGWFSVQEAFQKIRTTNPEKRAILTRADAILKTILPVCLGGGAVFGWKKKSEELDRSLDGRQRCIQQSACLARRTRRVWKSSITTTWFERSGGSNSAATERGEPERGEPERGGAERGGEPERGGEGERGGGASTSTRSGDSSGDSSSGPGTSSTIGECTSPSTSSATTSGGGSTSTSSDSSNSNPWITATSRSTRKHKPLQRYEQSTTCEFLDE
jgi:8-oxo-dGTP pyrophosphatase MutT (NUDIX family)